LARARLSQLGDDIRVEHRLPAGSRTSHPRGPRYHRPTCQPFHTSPRSCNWSAPPTRRTRVS
jgi:hypothetical protein